MPRVIESDETFETLRDECNYTHARLEDEPLASALAPPAEALLTRIDEAEKLARAAEREETRVDAARQGGNEALDTACTRFGDDLLRAVKKERTSPRWRGFFRASVSAHNREPLAKQVTTVRGWLTQSQDPVLLTHKDGLEAATSRVERAEVREGALAARRGEVWQVREELAAYLTAERDALHEDLSAIARENDLPRSWPDSFFRVRSNRPKKQPPVVPPA